MTTAGNPGNTTNELDEDFPMERLGDMLVRTGALARESMEKASAEAMDGGLQIGEYLIQQGLVPERDVYRALAQQRGMPFYEIEKLWTQVDSTLIENIPWKFLKHIDLIPIQLLADGELLVATSNPENRERVLQDTLKAKSQKFCLLTPTDYTRLQWALELGQVDGLALDEENTSAGTDLVGQDASSKAQHVALFDSLLLEAVGERASDIHIERYEDRVRIRLRIDGHLTDISRFNLTLGMLDGIVNVMKIHAGLDIAERRLPQGGRFSTQVGGQKFDLRVQTQPCLYGEHAVLRLLPHEKKVLRIEDLGFSQHVSQLFERALDNPGGLILVTGPTGSGKSTTLYSGLQILARDETRKVMTIEDPIEYNINNVQQTEARPGIGLTFASSTRAFLREDPDVILIGEIRDAETAMEALRAAETGHLVLSTLHCNDAVSTIQRLIDIGMPRSTISAELLLLVSQRLARRVCTGCRVETTPDAKLVAEIFSDAVPDGFKFYKGEGCDRCNDRGAFGRIVVAEALPATAGLRREIAKGLTQEDLKDLARSEGWITMRDHALELVNKGIIALDELPKILVAEQLKA